MVHFVVAGRPDCRNLAQVLGVLNHLKNNLPCFEYKKHDLTFEQWSEFLTKINKMYKWHHTESPLIYKENYCYGCKKPVLIGGLSEFWEYCYDYYGLECIMDPETVNNLVAENMKLYKETMVEKLNSTANILNIMFYGATNEILAILIPQIMSIQGLSTKFKGVRCILYDENLDSSNDKYFDRFNDDLKDIFDVKSFYCDNLREGLKDANLLIIVDDTTGLDIDENKNATLKYLVQMNFLAEEINLSASCDLRVIFGSSGSSSLFATILAGKINIPHSQIVVASSQLGLGYLGEMSRQLNIDVSRMGAPPVWGFIGFNEFVDPESTLLKCKIHKPNKRATRATLNSTLIHGVTHCELRFVNYMTDGLKNLAQNVNRRREVVREKLQREPVIAKVEALTSLIELWYGCTTLKEPIISLGVMSDGTFNIPAGIIFSQPAIQFRNGWVPYGKYPVPNYILQKVMVTGKEAEDHYYKYAQLDLKPPARDLTARDSKYKSFAYLKEAFEKSFVMV